MNEKTNLAGRQLGGESPIHIGDCVGASQGRAARVGFDAALNWMKQGARMRRLSWNGPGQCVFLVHGSDPSNQSERAPLLSAINSRLFDHGDAGTVRRMPHMALQTVEGATVPWVPSQTDCLAEDWVRV